MKDRLDIILVKQNYFQSREKAKASIMAGLVYVDDLMIDKPGTAVDENASIRIKENLCPYVSRGGLKLEKAIKEFDLSLSGAKAVDIGASTGGFTDCMLQNGAVKVYCIDVGYGQLDWKLRNDERVVNMEKVNVRYLDTDTITDDIDFISIDVSFISLKHVLPVAAKILHEKGNLVCLVKPQFEAGREQVGKNGIVRDASVHEEVICKVMDYGAQSGLHSHGLTFSPVTGTKGNIEYLLYMTKSPAVDTINVKGTVELAHSQLI